VSDSILQTFAGSGTIARRPAERMSRPTDVVDLTVSKSALSAILVVSFRDCLSAEAEDERQLSGDVADGAAAAAARVVVTPGNSRSSSLSGASVFGIEDAIAADLFASAGALLGWFASAALLMGWRPLSGCGAALVPPPPPMPPSRPDPGRLLAVLAGDAAAENRTAPSVVLGGAVTPGAAALAN